MLKTCLVFLLTCLVFGVRMQAQNSVVQEAGFLVGPSLLLSDYGQRNNPTSSFKNTGFGIGVVHYLSFDDTNQNITYAELHFKVRSEISYTKTILNHYSDWIKNNPTSEDAIQLKAMETKSSIFSFGSQVEYFPLAKIYNITETPIKFSPYVSLGLLYSFYSPNTYSSLGDLGTIEATFPKYLEPSDGRDYGFSNEKSSTWSVVSGVGTRYKLFNKGTIILEARVQWFNSDWIEGLNMNKDLFVENKSNDWQFWLNFGYIFPL